MKYTKNQQDNEMEVANIEDYQQLISGLDLRPDNYRDPKSKGEVSKAIFVAIFILVCTGGFFIVGKCDTNMIGILFGLLMTVLGCIAVWNVKPWKYGGWMAFVFPVIGLSMLILCTIYRFSDEQTRANVIALIPVVALGILDTIGVVGVSNSIRYLIVKNNTCKVLVDATCIIHKFHFRSQSDGPVYREVCPVYYYHYNGRDYIAQEDNYSSAKYPELGDRINIYVNPNNPIDFMRKQNGSRIVNIVIGSFFTLCGLWLLLGVTISACVQFGWITR